MNKKKITIILTILIIFVVGIPFIVLSISEKPLFFKDGILIVRPGDGIPNVPQGTPMAIEPEYKSEEQREQEQKELIQKLKEETKEQAKKDFENGIVRTDDRFSEEEMAELKEQAAKHNAEFERKRKIFRDVMVRFYGEEKIEKLERQSKEESKDVGLITPSEIKSIPETAKEWISLMLDILENKKVSDEELEILRMDLGSLRGNYIHIMSQDLKDRIEKALGY